MAPDDLAEIIGTDLPGDGAGDDDVHLQATQEPDDLERVGRAPDDDDVRCALEELPESTPDERAFSDEQDSDA
jgi:hypothetical protein